MTSIQSGRPAAHPNRRFPKKTVAAAWPNRHSVRVLPCLCRPSRGAGGNAGLAVAHSARALRTPACVVRLTCAHERAAAASCALGSRRLAVQPPPYSQAAYSVRTPPILPAVAPCHPRLRRPPSPEPPYRRPLFRPQVVPESTPQSVVEKLRAYGARVEARFCHCSIFLPHPAPR